MSAIDGGKATSFGNDVKVKVAHMLQSRAIAHEAVVGKPSAFNIVPCQCKAVEQVRHVLSLELHDVAHVSLGEEGHVIPPLGAPVLNANALVRFGHGTGYPAWCQSDTG